MRKLAAALITASALTLATIGAASAHIAPPCGDGSFTGAEYAEHHISAMAKEGLLGNGGHKPGGHRGYSLCLGVHGD